MTDAAATPADQVAAAKKALEDAQAALAAAEAAAAAPPAVEPAETPTSNSSQVSTSSTDEKRSSTDAKPSSTDEKRSSTDAKPSSTDATPGPLPASAVDAIRAGYTFDAPALEMGALVNGEAAPDVPIRIPIAMVNRHGLVAGATGTGKTKTLQVLAEQLSAAGVPVFAADIKGDLSGIASVGEPSDKLLARTQGIGQNWTPAASPTEYFTLGGLGTGIPIRASVDKFGPLLLSKVLGLNPTQESSLGLVFHYAKQAQLPLVDLADLRAVLTYLIGDEGKAELAELGGLSKATAGVILRELITFADQGAEVFFGEPSIDVSVFLRNTTDGKGLVSLLEVPGVQDKPALFSTFLMWLLSELYKVLPEVGDIDKPKLVFFFDEAHLLFKGASTDFLDVITQTVRLIRSKGVGIFFVTQTPKDVPSDVLAQLGSRVQHQLRAHTPDDAKALKATVSTYPNSPYDLADVLTTLATGEAIVTVMNEKGAPSPVAWTRLRAPQGSMSPTPIATMAATVSASPLLAQYGSAVDPVSAHDLLSQRAESSAAQAQADLAAAEQSTAQKREAEVQNREAGLQNREFEAMQRKAVRDAATRAKAEERAAVKRARDAERSAERMRKETVNAGVKVARLLVGKLFGSTRR